MISSTEALSDISVIGRKISAMGLHMNSFDEKGKYGIAAATKFQIFSGIMYLRERDLWSENHADFLEKLKERSKADASWAEHIKIRAELKSYLKGIAITS